MKTSATLALTLLTTLATAQNVQLGGSRAAGMGNAGLAYPQNIGQARTNPALLGFEKLDFRVNWPSLGFHTRGLSYNSASDYFGQLGKNGLNPNRLGEFARLMGDKEKAFGIYGDVGVTAGPLSFSIEADSLARTIPSASLSQKLLNGQTNFDGNDALDGYGYAFTNFDIGYGHNIQVNSELLDRFAIGARMHLVQGYYAHHITTGDQIGSGGGSTAAIEMNGASYQRKTGVGFDLGFQAASKRNRGLYYALVIDNLVEPDVSFSGTNPFDTTMGVVGENTINPFRQRWSVGAAYQPNQNALFAADVVDIYNQRGEKEIRLGAEYMFTKWLGGRIGYGSRNGATLGFTVGGFNVAISKRQSFAITSAFRF